VRTRMSRLALAAGVAALSLTVFSAVPGVSAGAATGQSLAGAGSDTTYWMMNGIGAKYNSDPSLNLGDVSTQIPPTNNPPFPASVTVPADGIAPAYTWDSSDAAHKPPDGSSAGISKLLGDTTGDVDYARSSRGPNAGETGTLQFWAYALGAVDAVKFPGSYQPAALSQSDLIKIYTCSTSTHKPLISNWSTLNKKLKNKPTYKIVKYAPQAGSGTLSFFQTKLLGGHTVDQNCDASSLSIRLQEHDARGVTAPTKRAAIYMFDWARWRAQSKHFEADLRNGSSLVKFGVTTAKALVPGITNVNETKKRFYGTRFVYNVNRKVNHPAIDTTQVNTLLRLFGVREAVNGGAGFVCSGKASNLIRAAGFLPLAKFPTGGPGLPSSTCRLNPKPL
jgi:ABC-type phosphate transport system substrate-binding protein